MPFQRIQMMKEYRLFLVRSNMNRINPLHHLLRRLASQFIPNNTRKKREMSSDITNKLTLIFGKKSFKFKTYNLRAVFLNPQYSGNGRRPSGHGGKRSCLPCWKGDGLIKRPISQTRVSAIFLVKRGMNEGIFQGSNPRRTL
jgi:hypothetical protein